LCHIAVNNATSFAPRMIAVGRRHPSGKLMARRRDRAGMGIGELAEAKCKF
jgi:hypothetical protein